MEMKEACAKIGIATPNYVVAKTPEDVERAAENVELSLVCEAPQQLRQCRLEPSIPGAVPGRSSHPSQKNHVSTWCRPH